MVLYKFSADWSELSVKLDNILKVLEPDYPSVTIIKINGESPEFAILRERYSVRTLPTCVLVENDSMIDKVEGEFSLEQGRNWLDDHTGVTLEKERRGELPHVERPIIKEYV